jgi:hypothetical protein
MTTITLEAAIVELEEQGDEIGEAMISLAKKGRICPSGERRNGMVVWIPVPELTH